MSTNRDRAAPSRPAYALAMVMLVMVVVGIASAVLLERQSVQTLAVRRHMDQYQEHHGKKGLSEVIEAYMLTLQTTPLPELVAQDPHLFDLELADASVVSVTLVDAQGRVLSNPDSIPQAPTRERATRLLQRLRSLVEDPEDLPPLIRAEGPYAVNAQSAPEIVLRAVALTITDDTGLADSIVAEVLRARAERELSRADIGRIASSLNLTSEQRADLSEMLTVTPSIWGARVELRTSALSNPPRQLISAYQGLMQVGARRGNRVGRGNLFLFFEPINPRESPPEDARRDPDARSSSGP